MTANDGGSNENTVIQIDGQDAKQQNMLEDGAYFMVQTTGMNNYFKNAVTAPYGDNDRAYPDDPEPLVRAASIKSHPC